MRLWPFTAKTKSRATETGDTPESVACVLCKGPIKSSGFLVAVTAVLFREDAYDSLLDEILYRCPSCKGHVSQTAPFMNEWIPCKKHAKAIMVDWEDAKGRGLWWVTCRGCTRKSS